MQKEHWDFPGGARALGELGEEEAGPTSKEPLLSSLPSSALPALQKAGTVCCWGWNVPCVSYGLCPVLHWLLYIYTYFFSCGILLSVTPALVCSPLTCPPPTHHGSFWVRNSYRKCGWGAERALEERSFRGELLVTWTPFVEQTGGLVGWREWS